MTDDPVMARFLAPRFAVRDAVIDRWQSMGDAETPGADAQCRLFIVDDSGRLRLAFAVFGPAVVIGVAEWVCEHLQQETVETARQLDATRIEQALALAPADRYAGVLVIDALANALSHLGS